MTPYPRGGFGHRRGCKRIPTACSGGGDENNTSTKHRANFLTLSPRVAEGAFGIWCCCFHLLVAISGCRAGMVLHLTGNPPRRSFCWAGKASAGTQTAPRNYYSYLALVLFCFTPRLTNLRLLSAAVLICGCVRSSCGRKRRSSKSYHRQNYRSPRVRGIHTCWVGAGAGRGIPTRAVSQLSSQPGLQTLVKVSSRQAVGQFCVTLDHPWYSSFHSAMRCHNA